MKNSQKVPYNDKLPVTEVLDRMLAPEMKELDALEGAANFLTTLTIDENDGEVM